LWKPDLPTPIRTLLAQRPVSSLPGLGRRCPGSAAKLGSLALIGGLAYKGYQKYQQGKPQRHLEVRDLRLLQ